MAPTANKKRAGKGLAHRGSPPDFVPEVDVIPAPQLRAKLGISAVTLWRWRHDEKSGFPAAKVINGRLYFPVAAVSDWLSKQPEVA